ncbi:hypothetical protein KSF_032040 [Reticulibacter mediterranei]|uniref:Uncharacterized protein n=1 Tax=Reticulibacter mediterranei TaxID=2778369 RepID=A0A8J3IPQ4_9CHLR|nr:hypothetical protein KSF_032040 [Reticulibacter mediterranei]
MPPVQRAEGWSGLAYVPSLTKANDVLMCVQKIVYKENSRGDKGRTLTISLHIKERGLAYL